MSAGTGIRPAEVSESPTKIFRIWVRPAERGRSHRLEATLKAGKSLSYGLGLTLKALSRARPWPDQAQWAAARHAQWRRYPGRHLRIDAIEDAEIVLGVKECWRLLFTRIMRDRSLTRRTL